MRLIQIVLISFFVATSGQAVTYKLLRSLSPSDGCNPESTLVEVSPGVFYGTTTSYGATLFSITSAGVYTKLANIPDPNLFEYPWGALVHADDGMLYGVTNGGLIFRSDLAGNLTTLAPLIYDSEQSFPLIEDATGTFYGVRQDITRTWGAFSMTHEGVITVLHQFYSYQGPASPLIKATDGNFYGTFADGTDGNIYRMSATGDFKVIVSLPLAKFSPPWAALTQGPDGRLYGGSEYNYNAIFAVNLDGSGFEYIAKVAKVDFLGVSTALTLANDGNFYVGSGTGGGYPGGKLFRVTPSGEITILQGFGVNVPDAPSTPNGAMTQGIDGFLYGTLSSVLAGSSTYGGIYVIDNNLTPPAPVIAEFYPVSGATGTSVLINGSHFLSASSVTINGVAVPYTVPSDQFIRISIPAGAKTSPIVITTPNGVTASAHSFVVQ